MSIIFMYLEGFRAILWINQMLWVNKFHIGHFWGNYDPFDPWRFQLELSQGQKYYNNVYSICVHVFEKFRRY